MATTTTKSKQRKSLCEESMLVILNILKFSSLSLAQKTLFAGDPPPPPTKPPYSGEARARGRAENRAPEGASKLSYVMLPIASGEGEHSASASPAPTSTVVVHRGTRGGERRKDKMDGGDGRFAEYIRRFHEKTENEVQNAIVEGRAADYIKRFHEKNRNDSNNESKRLPYDVLPPHLHLS